jgi:hypothetical protein
MAGNKYTLIVSCLPFGSLLFHEKVAKFPVRMPLITLPEKNIPDSSNSTDKAECTNKL